MPNAATKKTALARSFGRTPVALALALLGIFTATLLFLQRPTKNVTLGGHTYLAAVAATKTTLEHGLSNTASLPRERAMLFVFAQDDRWIFWMKDMRYALDIVWLNASKQVVWVAHEIAPSTYPETFAPPTPARYVLELPAGSAANVKTGDTAAF